MKRTTYYKVQTRSRGPFATGKWLDYTDYADFSSAENARYLLRERRLTEPQSVSYDNERTIKVVVTTEVLAVSESEKE